MKKQLQTPYLSEILTKGGQVFGEGIRRAEPNIQNMVKALDPTNILSILARPFQAMSQGAQPEKRLTVTKKPRKIGKRAHNFPNLFPYNLETSSNVPPRIERNLPVPIQQRPREVRGPGARMAQAALRGGEIYGEGRETSRHSPVRTSIF